MIVQCRIEGMPNCSYLQNRFPMEDYHQDTDDPDASEAGPGGSKVKVRDPKIEARKAGYWTTEGTAYIPSEQILRCVQNAGVNFKYEGRKTMKNIVPSIVMIAPEKIPLLNHEKNPAETWDEISAMPVRVVQARIVRCRPQWNNWAADFELEVLNPDILSFKKLREIVDYAGKFLGIGDYRPRYGRFYVTHWQKITVSNELPENAAQTA